MKRSYLLAVAAAVLFFAPVLTQATTTNFTLVSAGSNVDSGVYVGPYTAQITGGGTIQFICDNFNTTVWLGINWNAVANNLTNPSFLSQVKLAGSSTTGKSALQNYEAAAWLAEQIMANLSNSKTVGDMQYALWAIFSSSAKSSPGFTSGAASWYNLAINGSYTTSEFANVTFWTPNPLNASQEYISITPTPEPSGLLLLGTGLIGLAGVLRRKRA
jgi:hypothetical protein